MRRRMVASWILSLIQTIRDEMRPLLIYIYIYFRFGLVGHFNEDLLWVEQHSLFLMRGEKKTNSREPT